MTSPFSTGFDEVDDKIVELKSLNAELLAALVEMYSEFQATYGMVDCHAAIKARAVIAKAKELEL